MFTPEAGTGLGGFFVHDILGVICSVGLLVFLLIYAVYSKIQSLKQRIRELENSRIG